MTELTRSRLTNFDLSSIVFSMLKQAGVETLVVCAGARNAPLIFALTEQNFKVFNFFEERSAAFFALGIIKATKKPVAVLTTSGTAAAELLPAAVEATYQGLPLVLITADRPKFYRGSGAPQTIEQVGLYSNYVESVYDLDINTDKFDFNWSQQKPIHLNISFDEPLIDKPGDCSIQAVLNTFKPEMKSIQLNRKILNPLIILGEFESQYINKIVEFIMKTKAPVYAESLSQIKNYAEIQPYLIHSTEGLVNSIFQRRLCGSVIRIGGVPTLRFWRDLEQKFQDVPVLNYTDLPYSGLSRNSNLAAIEELAPFTEFQADKLKQIQQLDSQLECTKKNLFVKYPLSEQTFTRQLSDVININPLYLGNSLPIRNWDQFANCKSVHLAANRGANGIDGQIATYLGWSEESPKSYCYVGDLTALYDLAALGLTPQLNQQSQRNIIILNNFGGQIFSRVFKNKNFINEHTTQFYHWAQMWNWNYLQVSSAANFKNISAFETSFNIIEIVPSAEQTAAFWTEWDEVCQLA